MATKLAQNAINRSVKSGVVFAGFVLAGLFFWLAVREIDVDVFIDTLRQAEVDYVAHTTIALILFYGLKAHRWRMIMPADAPFGGQVLVIPMMLGFAANNILPLRLGELVRVYCAGRILGISKMMVFATLVVERLFDFAAISCIVLLGLILIFVDNISIPNLYTQVITAFTALIVSSIIFKSLFFLARKQPTVLIAYLPNRYRVSTEKILKEFIDGATAIEGRWQFFIIFLSSLVQWLLMVFCIFVAMLALSIDSPSFAIATCVLALVVFGISLPAGPAFIGTIEFAFVFALGLFGYNASEGLAVAVYYHTLTFGFVMLAGFVSLFCYRRVTRKCPM